MTVLYCQPVSSDVGEDKDVDRVSDSLPDPHTLKFPFLCGYAPLIPDLRIEKDPPKKEALTRLVSLRNQYLLAITDLIP
jgi:hypothetical protein